MARILSGVAPVAPKTVYLALICRPGTPSPESLSRAGPRRQPPQGHRPSPRQDCNNPSGAELFAVNLRIAGSPSNNEGGRRYTGERRGVFNSNTSLLSQLPSRRPSARRGHYTLWPYRVLSVPGAHFPSGASLGRCGKIRPGLNFGNGQKGSLLSCQSR